MAGCFGRIGVLVLAIVFAIGAQALASGASTDIKLQKTDRVDKHSQKKLEEGEEKQQDEKEEQVEKEPILPLEPEFRISSGYEQLPPGKNQPWRLVRRLQKAQDLIASGIPGAQDNYRTMLFEASELMLNFRNKVWSHERNLDAAAIYVLIGGNPQVGKLALNRSYLGKTSKSPLIAALAFSQRNYAEAYRMLNAIEPAILPPSLAGQFSLARAIVTSSRDLTLTTKYLNIARRLSPGTLIEEAALRRQLRIAGRLRKFSEFRYLSSTYMRRFAKSYYLDDFLKAYAYGLVQMSTNVASKTLLDLQTLLVNLNKRQRLFVLIFVARNGTILGKTKLAYWAATSALESLRKGSKLHARMNLYAAASGVVNQERTEEAAKMLKQFDSDLLDENDRKLFDAVSALSLRLLSNPLDIDQLRMILMNDQQTYPDEDPEMPIEMIKQEKFVDSNAYVKRFGKLSKSYDAIMAEVAQ